MAKRGNRRWEEEKGKIERWTCPLIRNHLLISSPLDNAQHCWLEIESHTIGSRYR